MWQKVTIFNQKVWVRLAGFEVHKLKNEGDDVTKSDDFQKRSLSSVGRIWGPKIWKLGGRFDKKWRFSIRDFPVGGDVEEIGHFQRDTLRSHGTFQVRKLG